MPRNVHDCSLMLNLICSMLCKYGWLCILYKLITKTSSCMRRTAGSTLKAARSHLRSQGETLLQGSARVVCLPPPREATLGITASPADELWFEQITLLCTWVSPSILVSPGERHRAPSSVTSSPGAIWRWDTHLVPTLGMQFLLNKRMKRKVAYWGAGPERGHPELQGGCNGVT